MELTDSALEVVAVQLEAAVGRRSDGERRIWIATPYIGSEVGALVAARGGALKLGRPSLSLRLLTDLDPTAIATGALGFDALEAFEQASFAMKSLEKLHAKVVVIDDWALVGSANLSQGGGYRNHELGVVFSAGVPASLLDQFDMWWRHAEGFRCAKIKRSFHDLADTESRPSTRRRAGLPRGQMKRSIGEAAKRLFAASAADELRKVCALRAPLPDEQVIADAAQTRAYRQVSRVALQEPSAEVRALLFAKVVRYHHDVGARVRATNHLREVVTSDGPRSALSALHYAYRHDPTIVVREMAFQTMRKLGDTTAWSVDGLKSPRSDWRQAHPEAARVDAKRRARRRSAARR